MSYLPNDLSFRSGLPEGKSKLEPESHIGRTKREVKSGKQVKRANRIRERSAQDLRDQKKSK